ncbi:MAG: CPBP family intramembrane metalloprotease [Clostridia bacterium]|nr:CPBP family intramembrane metalloprotease [Clostridia bacterium]
MDNIYPAVLKKEYAKTADTIALGLLLNLCLLQIRTDLDGIFTRTFISMGVTEASATLANLRYLVNIILYSLSFLLPAFFISKFSNSVYPQNKSENGNSTCRFPKYFYFILPAALGCITIAGRLTEILQGLLAFIKIGFVSSSPVFPDDVLGTVLVFISSAVIPAVVEEILFRRVILSRLIPYGKVFAVVMSSLLFAIMHANPSQLIYAFVGGLVMGFITLECSSVLPAMIIHFSNNTLSLIYLLLKKHIGDDAFSITVTACDIALSVIGVVSIAFIIYKKKFVTEEKKPKDFFPFKESLRLYLLAYLAYAVYLSSRWVYVI